MGPSATGRLAATAWALPIESSVATCAASGSEVVDSPTRDAYFLAKEYPWRIAWRTRSLLSRTNRSSAARAPQLRNRAIAVRHARQCRAQARLSGKGSVWRGASPLPLAGLVLWP
jgi:hypothetical protein